MVIFLHWTVLFSDKHHINFWHLDMSALENECLYNECLITETYVVLFMLKLLDKKAITNFCSLFCLHIVREPMDLLFTKEQCPL